MISYHHYSIVNHSLKYKYELTINKYFRSTVNNYYQVDQNILYMYFCKLNIILNLNLHSNLFHKNLYKFLCQLRIIQLDIQCISYYLDLNNYNNQSDNLCKFLNLNIGLNYKDLCMCHQIIFLIPNNNQHNYLIKVQCKLSKNYGRLNIYEKQNLQNLLSSFITSQKQNLRSKSQHKEYNFLVYYQHMNCSYQSIIHIIHCICNKILDIFLNINRYILIMEYNMRSN